MVVHNTFGLHVVGRAREGLMCVVIPCFREEFCGWMGVVTLQPLPLMRRGLIVLFIVVFCLQGLIPGWCDGCCCGTGS